MLVWYYYCLITYAACDGYLVIIDFINYISLDRNRLTVKLNFHCFFYRRIICNITVYLGALRGNDPVLKDAVKELGTWIREKQIIHSSMGDQNQD